VRAFPTSPSQADINLSRLLIGQLPIIQPIVRVENMRPTLPRCAARFFALAVLTMVTAQWALPVSALGAPWDAGAASAQPHTSTPPQATATATATAAMTAAATASMQPHAGYPTTREKWRYCPRDGSHQCVDLDIPGVTVPE
jgi:hypothetical protein